MKTLYIEDHKFQFPSKLNELTARQLELIMSFFHLKVAEKEAKMLILNAFLYKNYRFLWIIYWNEAIIPILDKVTLGIFTFKQKIFDHTHLIDLITVASGFLYNAEDVLTKQLFPSVKVKKKGFFHLPIYLFGPEDELKNIKYKEFISLDFLYLLYVKTMEISYLNRLCAVMYRPKNQEFIDNDTIDIRAKLFEDVPHAKKLAILEFYNGCRKNLIKNHSYLFPLKELNETEKEKVVNEFTIQSIVEQYQTWKSIPSEYSERPDEVAAQENVPIHTAIRFLDYKAMQAKKLKEQSEKL